MTTDVHHTEATLITISRQIGHACEWNGRATRAAAEALNREFPGQDIYSLSVGELIRFMERERNVPKDDTIRDAADLANFLRKEATRYA